MLHETELDAMQQDEQLMRWRRMIMLKLPAKARRTPAPAPGSTTAITAASVARDVREGHLELLLQRMSSGYVQRVQW